jgi:hypothetical protein
LIEAFHRGERRANPRKILLADRDHAVRQRGPIQRQRKIATRDQELVFGFGQRDESRGLRPLARGARASEERQFLFDAIEKIAVLHAHLLLREHGPDPRLRVFPRSHGADIRFSGGDARFGGQKRRPLPPQTLRERVDVGRRDNLDFRLRNVSRRGWT